VTLSSAGGSAANAASSADGTSGGAHGSDGEDWPAKLTHAETKMTQLTLGKWINANLGVVISPRSTMGSCILGQSGHARVSYSAHV